VNFLTVVELRIAHSPQRDDAEMPPLDAPELAWFTGKRLKKASPLLFQLHGMLSALPFLNKWGMGLGLA